MINNIKYLNDQEYDEIFVNFCAFRHKIASELLNFGLLESKYVLDLTAGHGFLSLEIKKIGFSNCLIDIGLINDLNNFNKTLVSFNNHNNKIQYCIMDATKLAIREGIFNMIANFLGLEDINMLFGKKGVIQTMHELSRIIKKNGILEITLLLKGSEPSDILNWKLWKYIGLNSVFYKPKFYIKQLKRLGFKLEKESILKTLKKMTPKQVKEEIFFACEEAPKIFEKYGVKAKPFKKVWVKFKKKIKKYGVSFYPEILVLFFKKVI